MRIACLLALKIFFYFTIRIAINYKSFITMYFAGIGSVSLLYYIFFKVWVDETGCLISSLYCSTVYDRGLLICVPIQYSLQISRITGDKIQGYILKFFNVLYRLTSKEVISIYKLHINM